MRTSSVQIVCGHIIFYSKTTLSSKKRYSILKLYTLLYIYNSVTFEWRWDRMFLLPIKVTKSDHVTRTFNFKKKKLIIYFLLQDNKQLKSVIFVTRMTSTLLVTE